jgi:hypothetical protein
MLLEQGESEGKPTMIMVSQPRRIAVTALKKRLQEALGVKVGLRLGNGVSGTIGPHSIRHSLSTLPSRFFPPTYDDEFKRANIVKSSYTLNLY